MKALLLTLIMILATATTRGQDVSGKWIGVLYVQGVQLRVVLHVDKPGDAYSATFDSPDQNIGGIEITRIQVTGSRIAFEVKSLGITYEGVLSEGVIMGRWMQSGTALYLTFSKAGNQDAE